VNPIPLTRDDIFTILDAVRDKFLFIANPLELDSYEIPTDVVVRWKQEGKINTDVQIEDFFVPKYTSGELFAHPFIFGRLWNAVDKGGTFEDILDRAINAPLLKTNLIAADILRQRLQKGQHHDEVTRSILEMGIKYHLNELRRTDSTGKETNHRASTAQQLKSELYHQIPAGLDWDKVAYDIAHGVYLIAECIELLHKWGPKMLVYRLPMETGCHQCKFLYLEKDGTPKFFSVSELLAAGCNNHRKKYPQTKNGITRLQRNDNAETWKPVAGLTHPWCQCGHVSVFTGMEWWANNGNLAELKKIKGHVWPLTS
jgi:hypothetical protein